MRSCPHCQTPIVSLRTLMADQTYDRDTPWYRPVEVRYTCPHCGELFSRAVRGRTVCIYAFAILVAATLLRLYLAPVIIDAFALTGQSAHFVAHELWGLLGVAGGVVLLLRNTYLVPVEAQTK